MIRRVRRVPVAFVVVLAMAAASVLAVPQAHATGFTLGDAASFVVLYEGKGGNTLSFSNSTVTGNIGINLSGKMATSVPGNINGAVEFSAANTNQFTDGGVTITGGVTYSQASVSSDLNYLNALSQYLGKESGTLSSIRNGGAIDVTTGIKDVQGNYVFSVASVQSTNGNTFTINGSGANNVVFNISADAYFYGSIVLTGGITSDQVLFNFTSGSYTTLTGGNLLTINTNGATTTGTFLDPNGAISITNSVLSGRLFGGDSSAEQISGATITAPSISAPPVSQNPEPSTLLLLCGGLCALGVALRIRRHV